MSNDLALTKRLVATLRRVLGEANMVEVEPTMVFEDFAGFNLAGIPSADRRSQARELRRSREDPCSPCKH